MDEKDINEKKSAENKNGGEENKKSKSRMILLIIAVVVFVCACVYIGFYLYNVWSAENETTAPQEPQRRSQQARLHKIRLILSRFSQETMRYMLGLKLTTRMLIIR